MRQKYWVIFLIIGLPLFNFNLFAQDQAQEAAQAKTLKAKIVFSSFRSGNWELWSINPSGTDLQQLTQTPEDEIFAACAPDGKTIAYSNNKGEIWFLDLTDSQRKKLAATMDKLDHPAFSPDGRQLTFTNYRATIPEESDIWIIEMDKLGKQGLKRLNLQPGLRGFPCISPDGKKMLYSSGKRVSQTQVDEEIWMINIDGNNAKQLTESEGIDFMPRWSPDGRRIIFASNRSGNYDIWEMDADGKNQQQLTQFPSYDAQPCFSPDGQRIVFISTRNGCRQLWVMDADGNNLCPVTTESFDCMNPCWVGSE